MSGSGNKRYGAIPKATQEIVIEDFAPLNIIDKPAGAFPDIQKRRYKLWYHVDNKYNPTTVIDIYVRAGRKNEWLLIENSNTETIVLGANVTNNTIIMAPVAGLTMTLATGWYRVEFTPLYNVNATTTGTGWNFQGGTAVLSNYSFRSTLPSTATASYSNNYVSRSQNFTTAQTSRTTDNRGTIIAEFQVTTAGTVIPHFRSEVAGGLVTLREGSVIKIEKLV